MQRESGQPVVDHGYRCAPGSTANSQAPVTDCGVIVIVTRSPARRCGAVGISGSMLNIEPLPL